MKPWTARSAIILACVALGAIPAVALVSQEYADPTGTKSWVATVLGYVDVSGRAQSVSAANPLPISGSISISTGALATSANQTTEITSLGTIVTNTGAAATAANQTTANGSLSTIATNSGTAATAANQTTGNTSLATIATNTAAGQRVQAGATKVVSVQFTRPAQTTAYASGQAVCASTSVDCTGLTFANAGRVAGNGGLVQGVQLVKSTTTTTNASFTVELYQTAPTITGIKDASTYSPTFADVTSGAFRTAATCTNPTVNGDNAVYQCVLPNANATTAYISDGSAQLYAMIQANAAYSPGNAEKFQVNLSMLQD